MNAQEFLKYFSCDLKMYRLQLYALEKVKNVCSILSVVILYSTVFIASFVLCLKEDSKL